ncbi:1-acylglycerol-3-phosphate O-acyltransferase ABHD5 [Elysia marginata]|uniref:1-acylglycerol-3-phosphate O-acyltransferase ABHD5 n=1 Tax=Elysia marginata TaxID=1093978 RepID=A0AAV4FGN3_9GAST|nr:1-acylglycerol-3-phosphate O-acyltransferase ABHD5 [Elysia marginata]
MQISQLFSSLPVRLFAAIFKSLYHSWFKMRWTPASKGWLMFLDTTIRSHISHRNVGRMVPVTLANKVHEIWTVEVDGDEQDTLPLVMLHGFGGGSNMFLNNIDDLAKERNVILIDLPGFGLSSRPNLRSKKQDGWWVDTTGDDIEHFYTEILERWFIKMGIQKCVLLGHSFGGYLCSSYCLKYTDRVKHLILADPWGFPTRPAAADMRPFMRNRSIVLLAKLLSKMNIFTPVRILGPLGPHVFRWARGDLVLKFEDYFSESTISDYLYACNMWGSPSGEIGFSRLSLPFGWAKKPMVERAPNWDPKLDVTFICGARSWIDHNPAKEIKHMRHGMYVDVQVISGAGHHVYADRPLAFNSMVSMICQAVDQGVKPNISDLSEARHLAMSILRRRASHSSQGQLCNDEAGIHMPRPLSAHELLQDTDDDVGSAVDEDGFNKIDGGPVRFTLDEDEETAAPLAAFDDSGDLNIHRARKSSFKTQGTSDDKKVRSRKVAWHDSNDTAITTNNLETTGDEDSNDATVARGKV